MSCLSLLRIMLKAGVLYIPMVYLDKNHAIIGFDVNGYEEFVAGW